MQGRLERTAGPLKTLLSTPIKLHSLSNKGAYRAVMVGAMACFEAGLAGQSEWALYRVI